MSSSLSVIEPTGGIFTNTILRRESFHFFHWKQSLLGPIGSLEIPPMPLFLILMTFWVFNLDPSYHYHCFWTNLVFLPFPSLPFSCLSFCLLYHPVTYSEQGKGKIGLLDPHSQKITRFFETGFSSFRFLNVGRNGKAVFLAADPQKPTSIVSVDLKSGESRVEYQSKKPILDEGYLSVPRQIEFPTSNGDTAYAMFYPPKNQDCEAPGFVRLSLEKKGKEGKKSPLLPSFLLLSPHSFIAGELPPLLVKAHGGPTGSSSLALNLVIQYWTTRGFGVVDVNYRGSTGYGRAYREKLKGNWGVYDVDDCVNAALHLANTTKEVLSLVLE